MPRPNNFNNECHYGSPDSQYDDRCFLSDDFDLEADYNEPRTHVAYKQDGRKIRVVIDHESTGTATTGTGDTRCRPIPKGFKTGDRCYA